MPSLTETVVDYFRARNTVETVPIRVIFFKGKTRFHWVNEVILRECECAAPALASAVRGQGRSA
jgi:hypothetical protein